VIWDNIVIGMLTTHSPDLGFRRYPSWRLCHQVPPVLQLRQDRLRRRRLAPVQPPRGQLHDWLRHPPLPGRRPLRGHHPDRRRLGPPDRERQQPARQPPQGLRPRHLARHLPVPVRQLGHHHQHVLRGRHRRRQGLVLGRLGRPYRRLFQDAAGSRLLGQRLR
jgi:hypothetical protein